MEEVPFISFLAFTLVLFFVLKVAISQLQKFKKRKAEYNHDDLIPAREALRLADAREAQEEAGRETAYLRKSENTAREQAKEAANAKVQTEKELAIKAFAQKVSKLNIAKLPAEVASVEKPEQERKLQEWIERTENERLEKLLEKKQLEFKPAKRTSGDIFEEPDKKVVENAESKALTRFEDISLQECSNLSDFIDEPLWAEYDKMFGQQFRHEINLEVKKGPFWIQPNLKFSNRSSKSGFNFYSLFDYYPKRYGQAPVEVDNIRRIIYRFKDGYNSEEMAKAIASAVYAEFPCDFPYWSDSNTVFSVIPASTKDKTEVRFLTFCELVSNYLGVRNGYGSIEVNYDREALKGITGVDKTGNLVYNASVFENRYVILFDDVKTSGGSFVQNANKLRSLGAKQVIGIFLGETYDSYTRGEPYWLAGRTSNPFVSSEIDNDLPF